MPSRSNAIARARCEDGMRTPFTWKPEHDERLRGLIDQDFSMSQIARKMADEFDQDFTRNSCCGRAFRLGIKQAVSTRRAKNIRNLEKARAAPRTFKPTRFKPTPTYQSEDLPVSGPEPLHLSVFDLNKSTCRWPYGDHSYTFCGHPPLSGLPYCGAHTRLSWRQAVQ